MCNQEKLAVTLPPSTIPESTILEQWRSIPNYPDYEISNHGRIKRLTTRTCTFAGKILRTPLRNGYPCVDLCMDGKRKTYFVHILVAAVFLGHCPVGLEVNHLDGIKSNPKVENLEYTTSQENQLHAYRMGLQDASGENNGFSKLTWPQVREIRAIAAQSNRPSYLAIGRLYGVTGDNIRAIVYRKTWNEKTEGSL